MFVKCSRVGCRKREGPIQLTEVRVLIFRTHSRDLALSTSAKNEWRNWEVLRVHGVRTPLIH